MPTSELVADVGEPSHHHNQPSRAKRWQQAAYVLLNHHVFGVYWDLLQALLAFAGFCFYVVEMSLDTPLPTWLLVVEAILTFFYVCDRELARRVCHL